MTRAERIDEALGLIRDAMMADESDATGHTVAQDDAASQIRAALHGLRSQADRMEQSGDTWGSATAAALDRARGITESLAQRDRDLRGVTIRFADLCDRLEDALFKSQKRTKKS